MTNVDPTQPLQACLAQFGPTDRVAVAVSGGGDSVAALVLTVEALGAARVLAVTVDHGLRKASGAEAAGVTKQCATLGIEHAILQWSGPTTGNLQDQARHARQTLIGTWAQGRVAAVILGHTLDDQAETVLMRLARGSGVDGLSGMAVANQAQGMLWLRPFLEVSRDALRDVLRARGVTWIEDPSNDDTRFQRVRARQALAALRPLGIDARGLADTALHMRRARAVLERETAEALMAYGRDEAGTVVLDKAALALDPEIRDRLVAHVLMALSGAPYRPRFDALQRLIETPGTLMGCVLADEGATLRFYREARAVAALETPASDLWDGRWMAQGPGQPTDREVIRALGETGLAQLSAQAKAGQHPHWRESGLSQAILLATPAIWHDGAVIAAPLAFWPQKWHLSARPVAASGNDLALSH